MERSVGDSGEMMPKSSRGRNTLGISEWWALIGVWVGVAVPLLLDTVLLTLTNEG